MKFVLPPAGMMICQLNAVSEDSELTSHVTPIHEECNRTMPDDYIKLTGKGIATNGLILALLKQFSLEHSEHRDLVHTVIRLLVKFGLLVPIFKTADAGTEITSSSGSLADSNPSIIPGVDEYVVPAQLPSLEPLSLFSGDQWIKQPYKTCIIWFSTERTLHEKPWLNASKMQQAGFMSPGLFQRLIAMLVVYC